ncbi:MFS transporter [Chloroflexota bacterium]
MLQPLKDRVFYGWVIVAAALFIILALVGTRFTFGVFFKSLEAEFELTRATTSSIFSAYMVLAGVLGIVNGWLLDRYGPRRVFFVMGLFSGLGPLITAFTVHWWQLFISYSLLVAIGTAGVVPLLMSVVSRWFDSKRGIAIGIATSGTGLGALVMSPLAAYLISTLDWRNSYIVLGLIAWAVVISMSLLLRSDPSEVGCLPDGVKRSASRLEHSGKANGSQVGLSLSEAARTRSFWLILFIFFFWSFCVGMIMTHVVPYATDLGISTIGAATVFSFIGGSQIVARLLVGRVSDVVGRKSPGIIGAVIGAAALILLIFSRDLGMFYLFGIGFGFFYGGNAVINLVLVSDSFGGRNLGTIMGIMNAGYSGGVAVGAALGGYIFDVMHSYTAAFGVGAVAAILMAVLIAFTRREMDRYGLNDAMQGY